MYDVGRGSHLAWFGAFFLTYKITNLSQGFPKQAEPQNYLEIFLSKQFPRPHTDQNNPYFSDGPPKSTSLTSSFGVSDVQGEE